jgi:CBS domain-containing protein
MTNHLPPSPPALDSVSVEDVMRGGIIDCAPETDLATVARLMADNHVHAVVVHDDVNSKWSIVTALDLVAAALPGAGAPDASAIASTEVVTIDGEEPLERAAQVMVEHQLTHLLVVAGNRPVGILSTLDMAGVLTRDER